MKRDDVLLLSHSRLARGNREPVRVALFRETAESLYMHSLLLAAACVMLPTHLALHHINPARAAPPRMGLFDSLREAAREVTVQHILVSKQADALEIYDALLAEGATSEAVSKVASERSLCGSARKRPDAKLAQLRGKPGELRFRRGSMDPEFQRAAFEAAPGTLVAPFRSQSGWHVMLVNE